MAGRDPIDREEHGLAVTPDGGRIDNQLGLANQQRQRPERCRPAARDLQVAAERTRLLEVTAADPDPGGRLPQRVDRRPGRAPGAQHEHRAPLGLKARVLEREGEGGPIGIPANQGAGAMADGVDGFDDLRLRSQTIEQPAGGDGVGHGDGRPQDAAVGPDPGDGIRELCRRHRSDLAAGLDPRRSETRRIEADGGLAAGLPAQQQQPPRGSTGGRTA